ncbi:MAG: hypothetical protein V1853_01600 [bacterium]
MVTLKRLYAEMLGRNLNYRFRPEHLESLKKRQLGLDYDPPSRTIETRYGPMVEEIIPTSLEPLHISPKLWSKMQVLCRAWEAFFQLAFRWYTQPDTCPGSDPYNLIGQGTERQMANHNPGYRPLLPFVRYDCMEREDGSLVVIDVNSSRPIGASHMQGLGNLFVEMGLSDIAPPNFSQAIADVMMDCYKQWRELRKDRKARPEVGIVIPEHMGSVPDFLILAQLLRTDSRFASVRVIDPQDLCYDSSKKQLSMIDAQGRDQGRLDLVLRTVKPDLDPTIAPALLQAYPDSACIVSPLYHRWLGSKFWFVIAQKEPYRSIIIQKLGGELAEVLFNSMPKSGLYHGGRVYFSDQDVDLESLRHKDWVAKVGSGSSSRGIIIGKTSSKSRWLEDLLGMSDGRMVFQEYTPPYKYTFTYPDAEGHPQTGVFKTKLGLYAFGGKAVGFECMGCMNSEKIHGSRSTLIMPVLHASTQREQETRGIWTPGPSHSPQPA